MLLFSKINSMDNFDDNDVRLIKHQRWSPSPVDLSITNAVPPASALIASLGSAYFRSGSPTNVNPVYPLNNVMVSGQTNSHQVLNSRKQREFIPDSKKDDSYWDRRKRNNEAAKRSREKRRISDMVLETRVLELTRENSILRAELFAIKEKFGLSQTQVFVDLEAIPLPLPENANRGRRSRLLSNIVTGNNHNSELNSNGNLTSYTSSSSPTSPFSSSSEVTISSPSNQSLTCSQQCITGMPISSPNNGSANCPLSLSINMASLPFKLRHKAKNNNNTTTTNNNNNNNNNMNNCNNHNDSDSGSDSCGNVMNDITTNHSVMTSNNVNYSDNNNIGNSLHDSLLKSENYALRSELQRLATEVASLKNVLVFNPNTSLKASNDSLRFNSYQGESRSNTPHLGIDQNEGFTDGSSIISNTIQSHKVTDITV